MLNVKKTHPAAPLGPGLYTLTDKSSARVVLDAVECSAADFEEMWAVFDEVPPTPNPMGEGFIKRRQGTYGAEYSFGPQKSKRIGPIRDAPGLVQRCVAAARAFAKHDPDSYTVAHCNWYPNGNAGLGFHQDNEATMTKGFAIFSFTFLQGGPSSVNARTPCCVR